MSVRDADQANSSVMAYMVLLGLLMVVLYMPEHFNKNFYLNIWRVVKLWELELFNSTLGHILPSFITDAPALYAERMRNLARPDIRYAHIYDVELMTFWRYGFVFPTLLAFVAWRTVRLQYECRGYLDLEGLIKVQAQNFPFIKHIIVHNPLEDKRLDVTRGKYAMRIKPLEFSKRERIITLDPSVTDRDEQRYIFHEDVFEKKCLSAMGREFGGLDSLRQEELWMIAALLLFLDGETHRYHHMLGLYSNIHYYLVVDPNIAKTLSDKVDAECRDIIKGFANPSPLQADLKAVLNDSSYGDDVIVVSRDIMRILQKHNGIDRPTRLLGGYFKQEYKDLTAKTYTSKAEYTTFESADYLPLAYKSFLATGMLWALGEQQRAITLTQEFLKLAKTKVLNHEEELQLESIENEFDVIIISHLEINASDILKSAIKSHNYTHGVILRLYSECGSLGVITANRFTWLQLVNKRLFLLLDDHGMPEGSAEVTFSRAHYDQEVKAGRKLRRPEVQQQVEEFKKRLLERVKIV